MVVAVFGIGERGRRERARGSSPRCGTRVAALGARGPGHRRGRFAPPPPWGPLELPPREAFLAPQEAVPLEEAAGRIAAESLAAYPPGIPNVLPGERIERRDGRVHPRHARATAARSAAPSIARLKTIRVVVER